MNKKSIILVIVLVSIAFIGLMSIQVYWIRNAMYVKQVAFDQKVIEALSNVVLKLDILEKEAELKEKNDFISSNPGRFNYLDLDSKILELKKLGTRSDFDQFNRNLKLTEEMFDVLMNKRITKTIQERIDRAVLDSLIDIELQHRGIRTAFEYGVFNITGNKMVYQKTGKYPSRLLNSKLNYSFELFPSPSRKSTNFLIIYFPFRRNFLLWQMASLLIVSLVLVLTIIFAFFYTVSTVFKQKRLSEMRNDFINNMTHEFKTPISTISLACEALKDKDIAKTETLFDNYIGIINEENGRLKSMSEKVLQTAIIEKGELRLREEWIDLEELIRDAVKKIKMQVERKNGRILLDLNTKGVKLKVDKMHFTNVILNLIDNANKYNLNEPEILISTEEVDSEGVNIMVQDNGIGISKINQKKIFDKLYRVPTGNIHNFKGFGLGLNYVKAIVDKHKGQISVNSELNKGTTFVIFMPFGDLKQ